MAGRCTLQKHPVFKWQWLGIYANCIVKPYGIVGRLNGDEAWQTSKEHTKMSTADNVLFYYMPYIIHVYYATKKFELFSWSDKSKYPICFCRHPRSKKRMKTIWMYKKRCQASQLFPSIDNMVKHLSYPDLDLSMFKSLYYFVLVTS